MKGKLDIDPRGLIFESYRIERVTAAECRAIFLDWALGVPAETDMHEALARLWAEYAEHRPDHPMSAIIREGLERGTPAPGRRRMRKRES